MEKLYKFLKESHIAADVYKEMIDERINICIGNVSCDMDSAIGAILLAYYMTDNYFSDYGNYEKFWIPVINCPRNEIVARLDIHYHLKNYGIDIANLVYIDDLNINFYSENNLLSLALIDHNKLDYTQQSWEKSVVYLVDHHVDLNAYPEMDKILKFCGSACSLVMNLIFKNNFANEILTKEICDFFSAAILIDTENLNPTLKDTKWSRDDEEALIEMTKISKEGYYKELISKKTDKKLNLELGLDLMLKKDYKNYEWKDCIAGISVVFNAFHDIMSAFGIEELRNTLKAKMKKNGLNFYSIITQTYLKNGEAFREIMVYDEDIEKLNMILGKFENTCPYGLQKKKFTGFPKSFAFYMFKDSSVSRKKVEPLFRDIFAEL